VRIVVATVRFTRLVSLLSFLLAASVLLGCGPGSRSGPTAAVDGNSSANVAARANEPRTSDPTAARPTPMTPAAGASASLAGGGASGGAGGAAGAGSTTPSAAEPRTKADGDPATATSKSNADPPKKIGARHVLVQWMGSERAPTSVVRSRDQALAVAQQVLKRAKAGDDFARLAIEFSDEPGAGGRGGSLGRFSKGQMVPAFEAVAFKLEVGQISEIVETPFGYHVIQRTE
jgi:peptidyl-prolyl cis-trans isomerase NIMA-interacting 1